MDHDAEKTVSESSYTPASPCTKTTDGVSSAGVSDNVQAKATESGLSNREINQKEIEEDIDTKSETWKKDDTFFFSLVTFRVEDRLFRVPKDPFENQSEHFRKLFANVPTRTGTNPARDIDEPIFLPGIDKSAFQNLLRLLYPPPTTSSFIGSIFLTREQWTKVLDVAQTWCFAGIRALAIKNLELADFGEIEKLELALKHQIEQWYADAYFALAKRPQPLSVDEGRRLGLELSLKMAGVRERNFSYMKGKYSGAGFSGNKLGLFAPSVDSSKLFRVTEDAILAPSSVPQKDGLKPTPGSKPAAQTSQTPTHSDISLGTSSDTVKPKLFVPPLFLNWAKPPANDDDIRLMQDIKKTFGL
ncbi:hypothetical protein ACEPAI_117 [Sanghuangporus weigelae]